MDNYSKINQSDPDKDESNLYQIFNTLYKSKQDELNRHQTSLADNIKKISELKLEARELLQKLG